METNAAVLFPTTASEVIIGEGSAAGTMADAVAAIVVPPMDDGLELCGLIAGVTGAEFPSGSTSSHHGCNVF